MLVIPSLTGLCIKLLVRLGREEIISDILPEEVAPQLHKAIRLYKADLEFKSCNSFNDVVDDVDKKERAEKRARWNESAEYECFSWMDELLARTRALKLDLDIYFTCDKDRRLSRLKALRRIGSPRPDDPWLRVLDKYEIAKIYLTRNQGTTAIIQTKMGYV